MPGTFSPSLPVSDPVTHVPWCMPGSLNNGLFWSRWRKKCSRHSRRMRNPQFCVSGKRPTTPVFAATSVMLYWSTPPIHWSLHQWVLCIRLLVACPIIWLSSCSNYICTTKNISLFIFCGQLDERTTPMLERAMLYEWIALPDIGWCFAQWKYVIRNLCTTFIEYQNRTR